MKVRSSLLSLTNRALYESFGPEMIVKIAQMLFPGYDIHARTGIPENIPLTAQAAADQLLRDVVAKDLYLPFIERLVHVGEHGYMGRSFPIALLPQVFKQIGGEGYAFDRKTGLFMESDGERASPTWGRLLPGEERQIAFLKADIVKNSDLVRKNPQARVQEAYNALREIVGRSVASRLGRIWSWEGDGCLCAFLFGHKEHAAVLSGMEIIHELFFFNRMRNPLNAPLSLRLAAHSGPCSWWPSPSELKKEETIMEVNEIESRHAKPGSLCASINIFLPVDRVIQDRFGPEEKAGGFKLKTYSLKAGNE